MFKNLLILLSVVFFASCDDAESILNDLDPDNPLTSFDVSNGLKEALTLGSKNASEILSLEDGFYKDEIVKILLPPEAQVVTRYIEELGIGKDMVDKVVLNLNRAAEDAVKGAAPIFATAITKMSIADAFNILNGDKNAATNYLKEKTYTQLAELFNPVVKKSLDKDLIAGMSTNESWELLTVPYNQFAESYLGKIAGAKTVNTKLDEYVTNKALDALFLKVADEEELIRTDPLKRVSDILKRVFGEQD